VEKYYDACYWQKLKRGLKNGEEGLFRV